MRWNEKHKLDWIESVYRVQKLPHVTKRIEERLSFYDIITKNRLSYIQFNYCDHNNGIIWNDSQIINIKADMVTPSEILFKYINFFDIINHT
jgi:hypothetical protein